jgi:hypothetical protein
MAQKKWLQSLTVLDMQPMRAAISAAASGDNTILVAVTGKRLCVLGIFLMAAGAVNATVKSNTTALSGAIPLAANGGFVVPPPANPEMDWLETNAGEALVLTLSGAVQVSGFITYYEF